MINYDLLIVSVVFIITSIIGSYLGAVWTKKFNNQSLIRILGLLLVVASFKVFFLSQNGAMTSAFNVTFATIILSLIVGFVIGIFSGFLGVAGGEFRIPALLLIFGIPIKLAGAANLLISIPTVFIGFVKHKHIGNVNKKSMKIAVLMGIFSVVGAIAGASLVFLVSDKTLLIVLSVIMLLVGIKMVAKP